jgi:asparagine synthase (glutamine-hydrolysing)
MSGIAAAVRLDGSPADAAAMERTAGTMAFRGPDGVHHRSFGPAALAVALLRTTREAARETGLATLDGSVWTAADVRIDARDELRRELRNAGRTVPEDVTDPELVLHAYAAWGDACVGRLLGDFAFVLWDAPRRRLVAARDHFGVKPLFHARFGGELVVSNTLGAVLAHPAASAELSETSLADFLVFGYLPDPASTVYRHVHALPPAHVMSAQDGEVRIRRYWALPEDGEELRYRRVREYVEHFREVLRTAVRDRLRCDRAAILLSGGRDSTSVAATAGELVRRGEETTALVAHTLVSREPGDQEGRYSAIAARALGIPQRLHPLDAYGPFERADEAGVLRPQPLAGVLLAIDADLNRAVAAGARVVLTGDGGDAVLRESESRLARLVQAGKVGRAVAEAAAYARWHGRLPRPGIRTLLRRRATGTWRSPMPPWMRPEAAERLGLDERWRRLSAAVESAHPRRPEAHGHLASTYWAQWMEHYDPGSTGVPLEYRHPFFDVRVARFTLSVPPAQWYNDKGLLRIAMRGLLPGPVLRRPKTPVARDPLLRVMRDEGRGAPLDLAPEVADLVDPAALPRYAGGTGPDDWTDPTFHMRPLVLSAWLNATARRRARTPEALP